MKKLNWKKIGLTVGGAALVGFAAYEGAKIGLDRNFNEHVMDVYIHGDEESENKTVKEIKEEIRPKEDEA